jgi:hypothetical protein
VAVHNCGDLPLTIEAPIIGDHNAPFQAVFESVENASNCPISSGTETLNPGAFCVLFIIFSRTVDGYQWPSGNYAATWTFRGWTLPGVDVITTVHLSGTLP